jgi:hypothetical protein
MRRLIVLHKLISKNVTIYQHPNLLFFVPIFFFFIIAIRYLIYITHWNQFIVYIKEKNMGDEK